ncbi:MAG TPA: hypothetical protein VL068_05270 [Microthrixaceae bacterium]|nr:hypothetical protein [Microthrixaceae bacterium]
MTVSIAIAVFLVLGLGLAKLAAEKSANSATSAQADAIAEILEGSGPREFMAFNVGVKTPGSLAEQIRDQDGFVNIKAGANSATIRFQPGGWWSGFTERCIVAVVTEGKVSVSVPKVACIRVESPRP